MRPPRALWVPFDLGRPLGAPNDAAFQTRVLRTVLALLERTDGPVVLEDFPDDAPRQGSPEAMEGMVCPVPLRKPPPEASQELPDRVLSEVAQLAPWAELFRTNKGRTTVGVSGASIDHAAALLADLLKTGRIDSAAEPDWGTTIRFAAEDLRNYYLEAAAMRPGGAASARDLADWFWGETAAGELLLALHPVCIASDNESVRNVGTGMLVPRAQKHRLNKDV